MFKNSGSRLFKQYFTIISLVVLVCFTTLGAALLFFVRDFWEGEKISMLSENARVMSESVAGIVVSDIAQNDPVSAALMICNNLSSLSTAIDADIFICDTKGSIVYCKEMHRRDMVLYTGPCAIHQKYKIPRAVIETLEEQDYSGTSTLDGMLAEKNYVFITPILVDAQPIGMVVAAQSVSDITRPFVRSIFELFGFSSLFALAFAMFAVYLMTYEMTKPLRQMSAATKSYAAGDFSMRVTVAGKNEMADLAGAFNTMAKNLASLESSRRSFVANVSHELKTPMTTIGGFIDGMLDGTIGDENREHYLRIVSDEVKRLSRLVTGMLNMSKLEAGELNLNPKSFDITGMIFKTTLGFERRIEDKHIEITGLDAMSPAFLTADEDMITQVVYNLLDNAVKFTPEYGSIHFSVLSDDRNVYVSMRNSGAGIPSEELGKIFERFYKLDKSRSFDVKGTGLGLFIVKNIVEIHGGRIRVSSVENQYTEFSFMLPVKRS